MRFLPSIKIHSQSQPSVSRTKKESLKFGTKKDGSQAIGIFNLLEEDQLITLPLDELQIDQGNVRDLWRQQDIGKLESQLQIRVEAHGVALLRIDPAS